MGDLISRSAVMEMLTNIELSCTPIPMVEAKLQLRDIPTAYDVEKVVAELEEVTIEHKESVEFFNECGIKFLTKGKAIEIVRNGGKE